MTTNETPYEHVGGAPATLALSEAFHARTLADPVLHQGAHDDPGRVPEGLPVPVRSWDGPLER